MHGEPMTHDRCSVYRTVASESTCFAGFLLTCFSLTFHMCVLFAATPERHVLRAPSLDFARLAPYTFLSCSCVFFSCGFCLQNCSSLGLSFDFVCWMLQPTAQPQHNITRPKRKRRRALVYDRLTFRIGIERFREHYRSISPPTLPPHTPR